MQDGGLSKIFPKHLPQFHWQSIESGVVVRGIPDKNYCFNGSEGWIEFKRTNGFTVPLRPEQIGWLLRRTRAGGRTFIAVRQKLNDTLWLIPGRDADVARIGGLKSSDFWPHWPGGPRNWDWEAIKALLVQ